MRSLMTWLIVLALMVGGAVALWADDDGGAPPPQPVVENQVPPDFQTGLFDMSGNRVADSLEAYQVQRQAKLEAFASSHPAPADGSGIHDVHGNYLGATLREAAEAGNIQYDPTSPEEIQKAVQSHGTQNVYLDQDTWSWVSYGASGKHGVTQEEFFADQERNNAKMNTMMRGVLGGADDPAVDAQTKNAISQTLELIEKSEREQAADLQRQREEAKKIVPLRTLRSLENGQQQ